MKNFYNFIVLGLFLALFSAGCRQNTDSGDEPKYNPPSKSVGSVSAYQPVVPALLTVNSPLGTFGFYVAVNSRGVANGLFIGNNGPGDYYSARKLARWTPIVKKEKYGIEKKVIYISLSGFDPEVGGTVKIAALREFEVLKANDYRVLDLRLRRDDKSWILETLDGKLVNRAELEVKKNPSGQEVGLEALVFFKDQASQVRVSTEGLQAISEP